MSAPRTDGYFAEVELIERMPWLPGWGPQPHFLAYIFDIGRLGFVFENEDGILYPSTLDQLAGFDDFYTAEWERRPLLQVWS